MRIFKNKKGFTLVELLAVIVVLSAVMLMAVNSVLPLIGEARTGAFASSANGGIEAVGSVILSDNLKGNNVQCYSYKYLIENGYITKIEPANNDKTSGYDGIIVIDKANATNVNSYKYSVYLVDYSSGYYYAGTGLPAGTVSGDDIQTYDTTKPFYSTCEEYNQASNMNWTKDVNYKD